MDKLFIYNFWKNFFVKKKKLFQLTNMENFCLEKVIKNE